MADYSTPLSDLAKKFSQDSVAWGTHIDAVLGRLSEENPTTHACITIATKEEVVAQLPEYDATKHTLFGIPFVAKDNINTKDFPTTAGTAALKQHRPQADAPVIAKLREAGAVLVAKTNMHEMAFGISCDNAHYGAVANPHAPALSSGGSSGGTGAVVGAGIVRFGLGSDTGGSGRVPAAWCGAVGFRPTTNRYDISGVVPISQNIDAIAVLASSTADASAVDAVLGGGNGTLAPTDLSGVRVGVMRSHFVTGSSEGVAAAFETAVGALTSAGVIVVDLDASAVESMFGTTLDTFNAGGFPIALGDLLPSLSTYLHFSAPDGPTPPAIFAAAGDNVKPVLMSVLDPASAMPLQVVRGALDARRKLIADLADIYQTNNLQCLIYPTVKLEPFEITSEYAASPKSFSDVIWNTFITAVADQSSVCVPLTKAIGLELSGPPGSDAAMLDLAAAVEGVVGK